MILKKSCLLKRITVAILFVSLLFDMRSFTFIQAKKTSSDDGNATIRVFSTSDLHGQSIKYSYDTGKNHNGSLAQIVNVINKSKKNLKNGTSLLVDSGDTVYGLGAATQRRGLIGGKQYMYKIMKKVGYDAITLGNHDFDYGFDYIKKCLVETGMTDKVVLSNLFAAKNNRPVFATEKIIKKTVTTTKGKKKTIKIGITGAVTPGLSNLCDTSSDLIATDIIEAIRSAAKSLKQQGADVVIALSHSGIGNEHVEELDENVSYRVTLIKEVDMVCAGHKHTDYPSSDNHLPVYNYLHTDANGLINGKPLVEEADRGSSVGITDLKLRFENSKVSIISANVKIRKITNNDKEDSSVLSCNAAFDRQFEDIANEKITSIADHIDGFFGYFEDNSLIQAINEAKISFAKKLIKELKPEFEKYPTIAATFYDYSGSTGGDDYINLSGDLLFRHILNFQNYNEERERIYYITGAQLREELEYRAASMFQTPGTTHNCNWSNPVLTELAQTGGQPVLSPSGEDWTSFVVFDGINYTINPSAPARYNSEGIKISESSRIKSLTINGKAITNDQIFTLAVDSLSKTRWAPVYDQLTNQYIINRKVQPAYMSDIIAEYLEMESPDGTLEIKADNNWKVDFPNRSDYIVKSSINAEQFAESKKWYIETLKEENGYGYYKANLNNETADKERPFLICASLKTEKSGDPVEISVQSSAKNGLSGLYFLTGKHDSSSTEWNNAERITGNSFFATENNIYTVLAIDTRGNKTIKYIKIENIDNNVATTPHVRATTNIMTSVSGTASPGATVYVQTSLAQFDCLAENDGSFNCTVSNLRAEKNIKIWQIDTLNRKSETLKVKVTRKGANQPIPDKITNKYTTLTGFLNDSSFCRVVAFRGNNVYIANGEKSNFKRTKLYKNNKNKKIIQVNYNYNKESGKFSLAVPHIYANQKITICSYDWIQRSSLDTTLVVKDVAPNRPRLSTVVSQEGCVYGSVPRAKQDVSYRISVKCNGKKYSGNCDSDGNYMIKTKSIPVGTKITVKAFDKTASGKTRTSKANSLKAISFEAPGEDLFKNGHIDTINNKSTEITGYVNKIPSQPLYLVYGNTHHALELCESGKFKFTLPSTRKAGSKVGIISRNADGTWHTYKFITVKLALPDVPIVISKKINESTKIIKFKATEKAVGYLQIGRKKIKSYSIKKKKRWFIYSFKPKLLKKKQKIRGWIKNKTGKSKTVVIGRVKSE